MVMMRMVMRMDEDEMVTMVMLAQRGLSRSHPIACRGGRASRGSDDEGDAEDVDGERCS